MKVQCDSNQVQILLEECQKEVNDLVNSLNNLNDKYPFLMVEGTVELNREKFKQGLRVEHIRSDDTLSMVIKYSDEPC